MDFSGNPVPLCKFLIPDVAAPRTYLGGNVDDAVECA